MSLTPIPPLTPTQTDAELIASLNNHIKWLRRLEFHHRAELMQAVKERIEDTAKYRKLWDEVGKEAVPGGVV